jgi:hypothetical protein
LILFSGKNVKACIIRWLAGGLVPFRMPIIATKERRILAAAMSYGVPFKAYGYNNLGVGYLPAPPIESAAANTDFGVAPLELLGKVFSYTFKPTPIGGRSVSFSGSLSVEFLPEILSLVWNLDGETPRRRSSREPTPEYGIQLTATSMLPEFAEYCFVVETHMAIPTRVSIQGSTDRPIISFSMDFYTPYLSWYTDRVTALPRYDLPVPPYSQNLLTIRDIGISFPTGLWADLLGLVYGFSLSVTKTISPVYTFPETLDFGVNYAVPTIPLVADEWGSVAQSIREGLVDLRLELLCGLASDINLEVFHRLFGGTNIYYYTREYFFVDINFANLVVLRAAAMVTDLSTSISPDDAYMVRAVLRLSEPIYVLA